MVKGGGATAAVVKSKVVLVEVYLVVWLFFLVRVFSFLLFCLFLCFVVFICFVLQEFPNGFLREPDKFPLALE